MEAARWVLMGFGIGWISCSLFVMVIEYFTEWRRRK